MAAIAAKTRAEWRAFLRERFGDDPDGEARLDAIDRHDASRPAKPSDAELAVARQIRAAEHAFADCRLAETRRIRRTIDPKTGEVLSDS